jgi:predicted acyltransferase
MSARNNIPSMQSRRLLSLDALRGFDMLFIMGLSHLICSVCELFPSGADSYLWQTMKHASWDGLYHHDTIFPLFLFIAGVSFPFSYAKQCEGGASRKKVYWKIIRRAVTLIALGVVYNGFFKCQFDNLRICSVLGRIGMAWALAALLYVNFSAKVRAVIAGAVLIGYWLLICYVPAPDAEGAAALSMEGNLVGYVDRMVTPGRLLRKGLFDPEGLLSTVPAVVTAMLGMFAGEFVRKDNLPAVRRTAEEGSGRQERFSVGTRKAGYMGLAALGMLAVGLVWSLVFPINKALWTSSFVLVVGSYSLAMFALFYYIIDVRGWQKWCIPFSVVGLNSITIYMAQKIVPFDRISGFFLKGFAGMMPEVWGEVLLDAGYLAVSWLFLYFLYKKKTFLKI